MSLVYGQVKQKMASTQQRKNLKPVLTDHLYISKVGIPVCKASDKGLSRKLQEDHISNEFYLHRSGRYRLRESKPAVEKEARSLPSTPDNIKTVCRSNCLLITSDANVPCGEIRRPGSHTNLPPNFRACRRPKSRQLKHKSVKSLEFVFHFCKKCFHFLLYLHNVYGSFI